MLIDSFDRCINYLRISVTDHCNYRCWYCRPEDDKAHSMRLDILSYEEIARIVGIFADLGISKVRLTGGEPLLRKDIVTLIKLIKQNPNITDLPISTNAHLLGNEAKALFAAGVNRANISLDSLNKQRFYSITRGGDLQRVLSGIDAAISVGMDPIKLNMVVMNNINDDEIEALVDFAIDKGVDIRFIETMPIGTSGIKALSQHYPLTKIKDRIDTHLPNRLNAVNAPTTAGPATNFSITNSNTKIGFIAALSQPFCTSCNRLRLTTKGDLILCLGQENSLQLKDLLRGGCSDKIIKQQIINAVTLKPEKHYFNEDKYNIELRNMVQVGG